MQRRHYTAIPPRRSATQSQLLARRQEHSEPLETEDYPDELPRMPKSAVRWRDTTGNQVIRQGNRQIVVHREPPPQRKRRPHWMLYLGIAMFIMILGWVLFGALANWWQGEQNNWTYGNPRTFQIDQAVGINDSPQAPSHFIAMNLHGDVFVIDLEGGNPTKAQSIPVIGLSSTEDGDPVTISFQDINGDGRIDMLVHVAGFIIVFLNNGKTFVAQHQ